MYGFLSLSLPSGAGRVEAFTSLRKSFFLISLALNLFLSLSRHFLPCNARATRKSTQKEGAREEESVKEGEKEIYTYRYLQWLKYSQHLEYVRCQ